MTTTTARPDADPAGPDTELLEDAASRRVGAVATSAVLGGAVSAALVGSVAGPIGTAVGAVVGAIAAGIGGNAVAESVDAKAEAAYWRDNYRNRPYVPAEAGFEDFEPAYSHGVAVFIKYPDRSFEEVESELSRDWTSSRGQSTLEWERAREASLDAWWRARHGQPR